MSEQDPNTFTQKDLMQHLLHAAQHAVTREEMAAQFSQAEERQRERFEQVNQRFEQRVGWIKRSGSTTDRRPRWWIRRCAP